MTAHDWAVIGCIAVGFWLYAVIANTRSSRDLPGALMWATFITPIALVIGAVMLAIFFGLMTLLSLALT